MGREKLFYIRLFVMGRICEDKLRELLNSACLGAAKLIAYGGFKTWG